MPQFLVSSVALHFVLRQRRLERSIVAQVFQSPLKINGATMLVGCMYTHELVLCIFVGANACPNLYDNWKLCPF